MFRAYRWPGNVRELHNAVQWALVMPERPLRQFQARADDVPASSPRPISGRLFNDGELPSLPAARREAAEAFELEYLKAILERASGNVTRAASLAKVSRQIVQKLLRKHNLRGTGL